MTVTDAVSGDIKIIRGAYSSEAKVEMKNNKRMLVIFSFCFGLCSHDASIKKCGTLLTTLTESKTP